VRVLVADDDVEFRSMLAEFLGSRHVEVIQLADGVETLRHVTRCRLYAVELDALVLDLHMPRLGGIDALRRIRAFDPSLAVIVVTAALEPALHRQANTLGARAVLAKPVDLPQLWDVLLGDVTGLRSYDAALVNAGARRPAPPPAAARVLVVDDDAGVRETLVEFLEARGYRTSIAGDGITAVRALIEEPADVVLLDVSMPGLSGAEALPTIRAIAPRTAVIMVTANIDRDTAKRTLAYGAFDYLVKPINWRHLTQSLTMALEMNALEAAFPSGALPTGSQHDG
jgi:two-component system OmpR family response regulator